MGRLTEVTPPPKSTSPRVSSNPKSLSDPSSKPTTTPIALVSLKVTDERVYPADGVPRNFPEKHTEVSERSLVLVLGIHLESVTPLLEAVKKVTTTELKSTRRSTDWALATRPKTARST